MEEKSGQNDVSKPQSEYNVFRDSYLRYMGYANEIGESFRYQFPRFVTPTYVIAFGYCGLDAISAGYKEWTNCKDTETYLLREKRAAMYAADTLMWQTFASVLIPGGVINVLVRASRFALARRALSPTMKTWIPTGVGIASIPIIIHPIDSFVDFAMDNTIRKWIFPERR